MDAKVSKKNTDGYYEAIKVLIEKRDEFLEDSAQTAAYKSGIARLVEILFGRARVSVDRKSAQSNELKRWILKEYHIDHVAEIRIKISR